MTWTIPRLVAIRPSSEASDHRVDGRALDAEQAGQRLLGELDPVAGAVLRVKQPARGPLGDRVEGVAGNRLHDLSTADNPNSGRTGCAMNGERLFASSSAVHRHLERRAADQHFGAREGRGVAAADDPADGSFAASDRGDLDRPPAAQVHDQRDHRRTTGKRLERTSSPRFSTISPDVELDHRAVRLDQRARLAQRRSRAVDCRQMPGRPRVSSSVVISATMIS